MPANTTPEPQEPRKTPDPDTTSQSTTREDMAETIWGN